MTTPYSETPLLDPGTIIGYTDTLIIGSYTKSVCFLDNNTFHLYEKR